jgi:general secretion pathway protein K
MDYSRNGLCPDVTMKKKNKGTALITALLITAIAAMLATTIAVRQRYSIRETSLLLNADQEYTEVQGAIDWAINQLMMGADSNKAELFPQNLAPINFNSANVSATLEDELALFNINSLVNPGMQAQFVRLLQAVVPTLSNSQAFSLAQAITNWISPSNADLLYLHLTPPYRASHIPMISISELRLVQGITPQIYTALLPYLTALPSNVNQININDAPMPILRSLADNMTLGQAQSIIDCRINAGGFNIIQNFQTHCINKLNLQLDPAINLVTSSSYFLNKAFIRLQDQQLIVYSLLQRVISIENDKNKTVVNIVWQSKNSF